MFSVVKVGVIGLKASNSLTGLPVGEALGEGIQDVWEIDPGAQELGGVEDAVGSGSLGGDAVEFLVVGPELELADGADGHYSGGIERAFYNNGSDGSKGEAFRALLSSLSLL